MATDLYKIVKYSDGEGLTHGDLNDNQRFLAAKLSDQILEKIMGSEAAYDPHIGSLKGANASTAYAYTLSVGGGNPKEGSTTKKLKVGAGTLFQKIANADGNNTTLLSYTFDGTDEFTLNDGHATLNRVDMLQMKLELVDADLQTRDFKDATTGVITSTVVNKKQRVQCTLSIKEGTAATNPAYPSPDSGYVPIACVVIGSTWNGAERMYYDDMGGARAVIHDLRMPIGIRPWKAHLGTNFGHAGEWVYSSNFDYLEANDAGGVLVMVPCPTQYGRCVGVSVISVNGVAGADGYFLGPVGNANTLTFNMADLTASINNTTTTLKRKTAKLSDIETTPRFTTHWVGTAMSYTVSGNGTHGLPVWANGKRGIDPSNTIYSGSEDISITSGTFADSDFRLAFYAAARDNVAPKQQVWSVTFYIAGGLP